MWPFSRGVESALFRMRFFKMCMLVMVLVSTRPLYSRRRSPVPVAVPGLLLRGSFCPVPRAKAHGRVSLWHVGGAPLSSGTRDGLRDDSGRVASRLSTPISNYHVVHTVDDFYMGFIGSSFCAQGACSWTATPTARWAMLRVLPRGDRA